MGGVWSSIQSTAVSWTVSGNSGITPFLTLFLMSVINAIDPTLLNLQGGMKVLLGYWYSLLIFGILMLLECIGKCVPVIDQVIDTMEIAIVPVISAIATIGTLGVFPNRGGLVGVALTILQIFVVVIGVVLALLVHLFKMLVRITGMVGCAGICQPCITICEVTFVVCNALLALFLKPIAILTCLVFLLAAGYLVTQKQEALREWWTEKMPAFVQCNWCAKPTSATSADVEQGAAATTTAIHGTPSAPLEPSTPVESSPDPAGATTTIKSMRKPDPPINHSMHNITRFDDHENPPIQAGSMMVQTSPEQGEEDQGQQGNINISIVCDHPPQFANNNNTTRDP